jgi:aryl-alcohol dehydrogenase-like predicted oxidoreductase
VTRTLGATGLPVSPIGLGLAALGRPAYITCGRDRDLGPDRRAETMKRRCQDVLDAAHDTGVRYLDAARSYGRAEDFLASWFDGREVPTDDVTVGSKWGYAYVGGWRMDADVQEVKDHSVGALRRQVGESRAVLGDRLRLYQIHSATLESGVLEDPAVLEELERLRGGGLCIGFTVTGPGQAETIERGLAVGLFDAVQATWNLFERSAGDSLARAHDAGLAVIVKEALANGRLTPHGGGPARAALDAVAGRHGVTADAVALAAALANPWVDVALSGAVTVEQLRTNLVACSLELTAADLEELHPLAEPADRYWAERGALRWS